MRPAPIVANPSAYHLLDFWQGEWVVYDRASGRLDGHNRIEAVLHGAALVENWSEADRSGEGKSWFYYLPAEKRWKQVWVTDAGDVKEKAQVADAPAGSLRFRGEVVLRNGQHVLDQTTLIPEADGSVSQVIEVSRDQGVSWKTVYDALYLRPGMPAPVRK